MAGDSDATVAWRCRLARILRAANAGRQEGLVEARLEGLWPETKAEDRARQQAGALTGARGTSPGKAPAAGGMDGAIASA